jgi:hypothetical protein
MALTIPQKLELATDLVSARVALERKDEALEIYAYQGKGYRRWQTAPDKAYANKTRATGRTIADLAMRFAAAYPDQTDMIEKLTNAGTYVCTCGGAQESMAQDNRAFGNDWGTAYDSGCAALRSAVAAVFADIEKQAFVAPNA